MSFGTTIWNTNGIDSIKGGLSNRGCLVQALQLGLYKMAEVTQRLCELCGIHSHGTKACEYL